MLAFVLTFTACDQQQDPPPSRPQTKPSPSRPQTQDSPRHDEDPAPYGGPKLTARLEAADSAGARVAVVEVQAPTAGYELKLDNVDDRAGTTRVLVTLIEPGAGEVNATVVETRTARANVPAGKGKVEVRVSPETRGLQYLQKPPYQLAATLAR